MPKRKSVTLPGNQEPAPDLSPLLDVLASISRSLAVLALRFRPRGTTGASTPRAKGQEDIDFLTKIGIDNEAIATIARTTVRGVEQTRYRIREAARKKSGPKGKRTARGKAKTRGRKVKARGRGKG